MVEWRAIQAGLLYCAIVFAAGFVLGVIRTMWVSPLSGELVAVALEAPVMLAIAWVACGWIAERLDISERFVDRLVMGGVALASMILAECGVAILAGGRGLGEYFLTYSREGILLGLLAQLGFAVFPFLRARRRRLRR
jgi:hypothetical protein